MSLHVTRDPAAPTTRPPGRRAYAVQLLAALAAYWLAVLAGRVTVDPEVGFALVSPATGAGVVWLLLSPARRWPAVVTGMLAVLLGDTALAGSLTPTAVAVLTTHVLLALVAAALVRRGLVDPTAPWLSSPWTLVRLAVAGAAASAVTAPLVWLAFGLGTGSWDAWVPFGWVVRGSMSVLVVGAILLELARWRLGEHGRALHVDAEGVALVAALAVLAALVTVDGYDVGVPFLAMGVAVWAGARRTGPEAALVAAGVAIIAVVGLLGASGPSALVAEPFARSLVLHLFVGLETSLAIALSLAARERHVLARSLLETHRQVSEQSDLVHAVAATMHEQVIVVDPSGATVWSNRALAGVSGDLIDPVLLRDLDGRPVQAEELPHRLVADGGSLRDRHYLDGRAGRRRVLALTARPLTGAGGGGERWSGRSDLVMLAVRDITREHDHVQQLQSFAGSVAHDLHTPLAGVVGFAELAQDRLAEVAREDVRVLDSLLLLDRVTRSAARMQQLVTDLLDLSSRDRGEVRAVPVDVGALARDVADEVLETVPDAAVEVSCVGLTAYADPALVRQVLANLVRNAVKYTPADRAPDIAVSGHVEGDRVVVSVADDGVGVPDGEVREVFRPFQRGSNATVAPGTGLGLAICQLAVQRHGGTMSVRPGDTGRGSVFTFDLPARPARSAGLVVAQAEDSSASRVASPSSTSASPTSNSSANA